MDALTCFLFIFFSKLIVVLIDSYTAFMDYSNLLYVCCPRKTVKFVHSLTLFNHVGRSFNRFKCHHRGCLNFSKAGLFAASWAHFICRCELLPTAASHRFAFLNRRKTLQEVTILIFWHLLQNIIYVGGFPYILCYPIIIPYFCGFRRWWKIF